MSVSRVASCKIPQRAQPLSGSSCGILVVTAGREHQLDPARIVAFGGLGRQDPGAGGGGPAGVGAVDEQRARAGTSELVGRRGADDPTTDDHGVVLLRHAAIFAHGRGRHPIVR